MKKYTGKNRSARYLIALAVAFSAIATTPAQAADRQLSCGSGTYTVTDAGVLTTAQSCTGDLVIDSSVVQIGPDAFYVNPHSITSLTIPDSVLSVGQRSFANTTAQVINIGSGLTSIGENGFGSGSIREFNVSAGNTIFSSASGVLFNKNKTTLIHYPAGKVNTSYTIPNGVTEIGSPAFYGGLYLQSVIIPDSVTTLSPAFQQNHSLRTVTLGSGISEIPGGAFYNNFGAGITEIIFSSSTNLKKIARSAFVGARWKSLVVPEGVETIEADAFAENIYLIDLRLPLTTTTLSNQALVSTTQLTKVCYLGTNTAVLRAIVASGKTVGCVSTPNAPTITATNPGSTSIDVAFTPGADNGLAITNYEYSLNGNSYIPFDPVTTNSPLVITGLTSYAPYTIRLKAVNSLGASAASSPATATLSLTFNSGSGDIACGTNGYFTMANFEVTSSSNCTGAVTIPAGTTSFGDYAFEGSGVTSINIPNSVTQIGMAVFRGATSLTTATFESGSTLTSIGSAAFERTAIASITLPESLTFLGNYVFWSNSALISITIPAGVTALYENSFAYITTLTSVTLPDTLTMIESETFKGATALASLIIPTSVSDIGANAFLDTSSLTTYSYCGTVSADGLTAAGLGGKTKSCTSPVTFNCSGGGTYTVINGLLENMYSGNCSGAVVLDSSVTQINYGTYVPEGVTSIAIPSTTTVIGYQPFTGGAAITAINVDAANPNYKSVDGILYNKSGTTLVQYPAAKTGSSFTIPSGVTDIGYYAFSCVNFLESVTIPDHVLTANYIDRINGCSGGGNISEFLIAPGNPNYSSINGVIFNKNATTILAYPSNKPGANYVMPSTVTTVSTQAFSYSKDQQLQSITLSPNLTKIETYSFISLNLLALNIPASVTTIDNLGLWSTQSVTVDPASTNYSMDDGVLYNYSKSQLVYYPSGGTRNSFTIPSTVTEIATYGISNPPSSLERLALGSNLASVGSYNYVYLLKYLSISEDTAFNFNDLYFSNLISVNYCGTNATTIANIDAKLSSWNNATRVCLSTPAFTLSTAANSAEVGAAFSGYTINSTGGAIASYEISPSISNTPGLSFDSQTGLISGTPTNDASSITYVITGTNLVGTTSQNFSITVDPALTVPAFTISSATENATAGTAITGFTVNSTGGAIASYSISPAIENGLSFNSATGLISGTPTNSATSRVYTITGTNRVGSTSVTFTIQVARSAAQIAAELEAQRVAAAAEAKRLADLAAEAKRIADAAAEAKRIADEAEAKRIADAAAAEAKRIADEAEAKRIADAAAAEAKRVADAAEAKRLADLAAEAKRVAEQAAEAKRRADAATEAKRLADEVAKAKAKAQLDAQRAALTGTKKVSTITKVSPKKAIVKLINLKPGTKVSITIKIGKK